MKLKPAFICLFLIFLSSIEIKADEIKFSKITVYNLSKSGGMKESIYYSHEFNVDGTIDFYLDEARIVIKYMMYGFQHINVILVEKKEVINLNRNVKEIRYSGKWDEPPHYHCSLSVYVENKSCKIEMKEFQFIEDENTYSGFLYKYNTNNECP
jgi:hypothetical protein